MAIDVYLQIEGMKGESQDDKHKDWIEASGSVGAFFSRAVRVRRPLAATPPSGSR